MRSCQIKFVAVKEQPEEIRIVRVFRRGRKVKAKFYSTADDGTKIRQERFLMLATGKTWRDQQGNEYHAEVA
ncbi:MAG: hypothetical protein Q7S84_02440 [bacterium]|nr:hypothetical protein [bacterium]